MFRYTILYLILPISFNRRAFLFTHALFFLFAARALINKNKGRQMSEPGNTQYHIVDFAFDVNSGSPAEKYIDFGDLSAYNKLSVNVFWENLDMANAYVTMSMRQNTRAVWTKMEFLTFNMSVATGSCVLINKEFVCTYGGIYVNRGSCTTGVLHIWAIPQTISK